MTLILIENNRQTTKTRGYTRAAITKRAQMNDPRKFRAVISFRITQNRRTIGLK